jgi:hypothetical protein
MRWNAMSSRKLPAISALKFAAWAGAAFEKSWIVKSPRPKLPSAFVHSAVISIWRRAGPIVSDHA